MQAQQILELIEAEELRRIKYEVYRRDPLLWVEEVMGEDPRMYEWSKYGNYENHVWDGDRDPLANAWRAIARGEWSSVPAATGTGKTFWLSRLVFWFLDCFEDSLVVTSAPKESQLKLHLWAEIGKSFNQFKTVRPSATMFTLSLKPEGGQWANPNVPYFNSHQAVGFVAGVGADEQSSTKAQGFHRKDMLIIAEECAGMNGAIMTAFQNTCTGTNNILVAVGNPDSEQDELFKFGALGNVNVYRISAFDHPNVVLKEDLINGAVTIASIERRKQKYGVDSPLYVSRVRGITPSDGDNNLIKSAWINQCNKHHKEFIAKVMEGYNAVGVDVSNSENGDKACTVFGRGNVCDHIQEFQCPNASDLAVNLIYEDYEIDDANEKRKHNGRPPINDYGTRKLEDYGIIAECIGVDTVGVGVSTLNTFNSLGFEITALSGGKWVEVIPLDNEDKPMYDFGGLRDQMYWELREDIRTAKVVFDLPEPMMVQLARELRIPKFALSAGAVKIESKEQIKKRMGGKSPNVADAAAYWNWVRKGYRIHGGALPIMAAATGRL